MYESAERKLSDEQLMQLGVDPRSLRAQLQVRREAVESGTSFEDIEFKLWDEELIQLCRQACDIRGLIWGTVSPMKDEEVIHRHLRRDRTEVLAAREEALWKKRADRQS